jgi:hypothetical protein
MARNFPFDGYPFKGYPYESFPFTGYPYGDGEDGPGRAVSLRTGGAHSSRSIAWSVVVLTGLVVLFAFKILRLVFKILFAIIRHLKRRDPYHGSPSW